MIIKLGIRRISILWRRLRSRKFRFAIDTIDIFLLSLVILVAPPRRKEWKQGVRAFITLAALSAMGLLLLSRYEKAAATAALGVAILVVLIAAAFIRVARA
jgi:hypothetical protein